MLLILNAEFIVALSWVFLSNVYSQSLSCGNVNTDLQNTNAEGAWPWMVAITKRERDGHYIQWCNGFLIDRKHVLTAAHCFDMKEDESDFLARIGKMNRSEGEAYEVTCITKHPRYERGLYYDDIAILTLSRIVDTLNYNPICLPDENLRIKSLNGFEVTKTAWGAVKPGGIISETLIQNAGLRIIPNVDCNTRVRRLMRTAFTPQFPGGVSFDMVCTENPTEQTEPCGGDSGAPLMYRDESDNWIAVGVSAFGFSCKKDAPSGFIMVSAYLEWIIENTIDGPLLHCTKFSDEDLNQLIVHYDDEDIRAGSTANFSCKLNDLQFSGKSESVCCRDGKWSSPPPKCKVKSTDPAVPCTRFSDDDLKLLIVYDDDKARFSCKDKVQVLSGKNESVCLGNGKWSSPPPQCKEPTVPCTRFSDDDLKLMVIYGDDKVVRFSCKDKDQVLSGKNESMCLRNGKWLWPPPQCKGCGTRLDDYRPYVGERRSAAKGAWPWMVDITKVDSNGTYMHCCSGVLIDRRHVLSAASCFTNSSKRLFQVRIGQINFSEGDIYLISRIAVHPGYRELTAYDNIAILTLDQQVTTHGYNAICLPDEELSKKDLVDKETSVVGWRANYAGPILQQFERFIIMDNQECNMTLMTTPAQSKFPQGMNTGFICTGPERWIDCLYFGGGILMYQENSRWYAIGILSYPCSSKTPLSVYTKVSKYSDWIAENTSD